MKLDTEIRFSEQEAQFKVNLNKKQMDIVDHCMVVDGALKKGLDPKRISDFAVNAGLSFSESTYESMEKMGYQFADDVATPAIGNWTFGTLNMVVQEVGSSLEKDTLLSLAFPDKSVPMYKVMLDRIKGNTGMGSEFAGDSSPIAVTRPLDTYGLTYESGLWANRTMLTAKRIAWARKLGMVSFDERGIGQLVAYNSVNLVTQMFTRKNHVLNQAIFSNGYSYAGQTVSSNIPSGNALALDSMGTLNVSTGAVTYTNADPLYSPLIAITNQLNNPALIKYHSYIRGVICNTADLQAIINHPNVKPTLNALAMGSLTQGKSLDVVVGDVAKQINAYYAPGYQFPFLADRETWQEENPDGTSKDTNNFFVPRGKMFILMDLTSFGGQLGAFHLTYNEVDPNIESQAMGLFTGVFNRNLENSDTVNRLDIVASISGAPAIYMSEAIFTLTNLYSNV